VENAEMLKAGKLMKRASAADVTGTDVTSHAGIKAR